MPITRVIDLGENVRPDQVQEFMRYWEEMDAGKKSRAITVGGGKGFKIIELRPRKKVWLRHRQYMLR